VAKFRPHLKNGIIQEGLAKLAKNFYPTCPYLQWMVLAWLQMIVPRLNLFLCYLERSEFIRGKKLTEGTF
jgi:hypothetical protein